MEYTEKVLILKVGRFRETDAWVRVLSPTRGVYTAFAFGGMVSRRRFCGCLDFLNTVLFRVKSDRQGHYLCLEEGSLLGTPSRLRHDGQRLGLAVNCLKFLEAVSVDTEGAAGVFALAEELLEVLDGDQPVTSFLPMLFRARVAFEHGYALDVETCGTCGGPACACDGSRSPSGGTARALFLVEQGRLACQRCASAEAGMRLALRPETLAVLDAVRARGPREWRALNVTPEVRREYSQAVDAFVRFHLGLAWEKGGFRRI